VRPAHCMIHVRDLDRAAAFYGRALGFKEVDRHRYDGATLAYLRGPASPFEIELIQPDLWPYESQPEPGRTHIAFVVEDLEAERIRLAGIGVEPTPTTSHVANGVHQTRYFYFADFEGNQVEFLEAHGRYGGAKEEESHAEPIA
jgi:lactoylglutathione lyase